MSENKPENEQLAKPTRELTEKERIRFEGFQKICAEKKAQGFVMKDKTYGVVYANVMAFVLFIPFVIIFALLFLALLPSDFSFTYNPLATWIIILAFIVSIFIHDVVNHVENYRHIIGITKTTVHILKDMSNIIKITMQSYAKTINSPHQKGEKISSHSQRCVKR